MLLFANTSFACIWDYDTLRDERRGLPGVAEVLSGQFEKRSQFFYRDRIARMEKLLKEKPDDQDAIDNLAVALFRVGEFDRAVSLLQDKEKRFPNQYTTASNLATFYMLHGNIDDAIPLLEKALTINPNAHFGREKYQLKLARFLRAASTQPAYPVEDFLGNAPLQRVDGEFGPDVRVLYSRWNGPAQSSPEEQEAIDAIVGMIRFGTDQSPDLWYALGDLLSLRGDRHLAMRAFMRASEAHHPLARQIDEILVRDIRGTIPDDMRDASAAPEAIARDRKAGEEWARAYMDYADNLIRRGIDPDTEANYADFYAQHGAPVQSPAMQAADWIPRGLRGANLLQLISGSAALLALISAFVWREVRLRRRKSNA